MDRASASISGRDHLIRGGQVRCCPSRRDTLFGCALATSNALFARPLLASRMPPAPPVGDCTDCVGEVNNTLNACELSAPSCVSTLNDDALHFYAPWQYEGSTEDAVSQLIAVATGGQYEPGLINEPFGISKLDAAGYIVKGVLAVLQNGPMPEQPQRRRAKASVPFNGVLADRHSTANGSEYVRITFGGDVEEINDPSNVIDAEFLFFVNDNIVNVRAISRADPTAQGGELALSFTSGVVFDRNTARRRVEALRTALRWEPAPVITDFDPKFNPEAPVWLERVFRPFDSELNSFEPSGVPYPVDLE